MAARLICCKCKIEWVAEDSDLDDSDGPVTGHDIVCDSCWSEMLPAGEWRERS